MWGVTTDMRCVTTNLLLVIIKYSSMGYGLYFINQSGIQSILKVASLPIISFPT